MLPLAGSGGIVLSIPMPCLGFGAKRITVIGGTYFRLFPIQVSDFLLRRGVQKSFLPMVYLHPYDSDATARGLEYPNLRFVQKRLGDRLRRAGRANVARKVRALARNYNFRPVETGLPRPNPD
jgi:hypothetical protein